MHRRVTVGLGLLRTAGLGALAVLLWNPATSRPAPPSAVPLVLLDASLSLGAHGGQWRKALDTARTLAQGGVIWRFGARVTGFDTLPPTDGASRLGPALDAAAARGSAITVVTDGAIDDLADLPPDLLRRARVIVLARRPFRDAFVASLDGPRHVAAADTVRLTVSYGVVGPALPTGPRASAQAELSVSSAGRRLAARTVSLPDSGVVATTIPLAAALLPAGWSALDVRLNAPGDSEPRDDARSFAIEVSPQPRIVVLAAPPDWETRFLARTLEDIARVPVKAFVAADPGESRWRDATTLETVTGPDLTRVVAAAELVVEAGDSSRFTRYAPKGAVLVWPLTHRQEGDWYVEPPTPSPLASGLAGVTWDSLPPATALADLAPDSGTVVALTARLGRRGASRPIVTLSERGGRRRAVVAAAGLYRWVFRGGASAEAYRSLMAAVTDWLLAPEASDAEHLVPVAREVPNGMPLEWRWTGPPGGDDHIPADVVVRLAGAGRERQDTLRFDATGRAFERLPAGVYQYAVGGGARGAGGAGRGVVIVDTYSDEWRPTASVLSSQPGAPDARLVSVALRERWWLFVVAIAAFAAEWAWRRRQGLP